MCAVESMESRVERVIAVLKLLEAAQGQLIKLHDEQGSENFTIEAGNVMPAEGPQPIRPKKDECWPAMAPLTLDTLTYRDALEQVKTWMGDCWRYLEEGRGG